ncbi:hypothetical protein M2262_000493 [Pseudomonas sp. BIGb0408]|uniref:Apea-like HEPN domain-containing protein n=1 Tax=Phytopseudomonas flavescens TaxID=29435 RepID=A0A7Y9XRN3_9GAMM|nr:MULTISPECIES: hypothetical protein [Pseudomonas]MCW2290443.1 hypothetical protein [Pseudomonas sp. BIGb0408]NYH74984.1 hypothetical protein [Pseudomonas flavescens]
MSTLRYLQDAVWEKLPFEDFRPRFFVESYSEKLRMYTPHFYQSRLLNTFSACLEMIEHVDAYQENDKNGGYILSSMDEIIECWESDPIAQEIFSELAALKADLAKKVKSGELDSNVQARLKVLCRTIIGRQQKYLSILLERLEEAIVGTCDLAQTERITASIDRLTGLYTTFLLNQGYSPTYLYNRCAMFFRKNNYSGRNFSEQFRMVTERLRNQQSQFDIYYGFHAAKPNILLSVNDEPGMKILSDAPKEIAELKDAQKDTDINVLAKLTLTSTDYISAALQAKEKIDRFLDTTTAFEFGSEFRISDNCITIRQGQLPHRRKLNVGELLAFISSENGTAIPHDSLAIHNVFKSLNEPAKEQLGRSLRHLRLAKVSVSLEQKLLNLWIALESLFTNTGSSIIGNILDFVPPFYAVAGIPRRVRFLRELLTANNITVTPLIADSIYSESTTFTDSLSDEQVFLILRNADAAKELFYSIEKKEHLKFKLMKIFKEIENNKSISVRLAKSKTDVNRQLRRIYFLRNKIAHTGHFRGVRPQLVTHLLDYVATTYRVIAAAAGKAQDGHTYSISELLAAASMGTDLISAKISSKDEISTLDQITLQAVI